MNSISTNIKNLRMLDYIITDIAVNNKWLYSVLGVITELSKPNTK